jgi:uncharacterized protein YegP (UPF0339 family)
MKTEPRVTDAEPNGAVIDLWKERTGEWRWRYRETNNHTDLLSNEDYRTRVSAERAARISYPGVPVIERAVHVEPGSKAFWALLLGGGLLLALVLLALLGLIALAMIAVGWRQFRRRLEFRFQR